MKNLIAISLVGLTLLTGCKAQVDLQNAAVGQGNINSIGAVLGSVYLYDTETKTPAFRVFDVGDLGFGVYENTGGSYSTSASRGISMEIDASVKEHEAEIRAAVSRNLEFSVVDYKDRRFAAPSAVLNHAWTQPRIKDVMPYAGQDRYRFILVQREYRGSTLNYGWNASEAQPGNGASVTVGSKSIKIELLNSNGVTCEGVNSVCLITASVWKLGEDGRFAVDPGLSNSSFIQSAFGGNQ